jgi:hypothetical protein
MPHNKAFMRFTAFFLSLLPVTLFIAMIVAPVAESATTRPAMLKATPAFADTVAALVGQANVIARAQVVQSTSYWNSDHTLIETEHTLAIRYTLLGAPAVSLRVYTDGGYLPDEGLGMRASHTATFAPEEEVFVFLQETTGGFRVVGGDIGKFTVINGEVIDAESDERHALNQWIATILATTKNQGRTTLLPADWRDREPIASTQPKAIHNPLQIDPKWPGAAPKVKAKVNLNSSQIGSDSGSAAQFLAALQNALRTWSVVPEAEFTIIYDGDTTSTSTGFNSMSEILFMKKGENSQVGQAQIWFTSAGTIVEADVWFNDDYSIDTTGSPAGNELDLESVALHEVGHWLPVGHLSNPDAVMYITLGHGIRRSRSVATISPSLPRFILARPYLASILPTSTTQQQRPLLQPQRRQPLPHHPQQRQPRQWRLP